MKRALPALSGSLLLCAMAIANPQDSCATISLDKPIYVPGDTAILTLSADPGLVPFLFVSPSSDPVTSSPYGGRRFAPVPSTGEAIIRMAAINCESPEKFLQVALFDPLTRRATCVSNDVFLSIDLTSCGEPPPPPMDCGECDGKVTELTMRYNGADSALIEVFPKKRKNGTGAIFEGIVDPGGSFQLIGMDKKGTLGTEIELFIDGVSNVKIHTSCSRPIGPGLIAGQFEILSGASRNGGELCPVDTPPAPSADICEGQNKPMCLTMVYAGSDCGATTHSQDPDKVNCFGDPALDSPVIILVTDKKGNEIYFHDAVELNQSFIVSAKNTGKGKFGSATFATIFDVDGNLLQEIEFHTSCSQPLSIGNQFGALQLVGYNEGCN